ncbi:MAG TPA: (2Fe-2S)-binding protein [Actinomycetota bacterium]
MCLCRLVTDATIRCALENGARTFGDLARRCDVGKVCGSCRPAVEELLAAYCEKNGIERRSYRVRDAEM